MFGDCNALNLIKFIDWTFRYLEQNSYSNNSNPKVQENMLDILR